MIPALWTEPEVSSAVNLAALPQSGATNN